MNRLLGLELLRGVAATLVLLEHLRWPVWEVCGSATFTMPASLNQFEGYWGVDIFFVLSGYLIGLTLDKPGTTARSFLKARAARILPLYLVASAICLAAPALRVNPLTGPAPLTAAMAVTTATLLPLAGDALDPVAAHPFGWTLCYEMGFYLVATALAAAVGARRAVPAMVGLFLLAPAAFTAAGPVPGWAFPNFALSPLTCEFALGLVAYRTTGRLPKWAGWALVAVAVAGFVRAGFAPGNYGMQSRLLADPLLAWTRVARYGLPAFAGVLGVARLDCAGTFAPVARLATAVGAVSYSLYLVQPFAAASSVPFGVALGFTQAWPTAAAVFAGTLLAATAVARYVDLPLHAAAKRWLSRPPAPRPASVREAASPPIALEVTPR